MEMLELAAELKWCREQIATYEVEREQMQIYYRRAITERDNAKATISRLLRYAYHEEECAVMICCGDLPPCDCGYDELMEESK